MSIFTSPRSKALTVLLWGDRWWLAGRTEPIPFAHRDEAAGELVAALAGDAPRRLRLIYQPDGFMSVVTPCPKAGRRMMALALQEQFPGLATDEIAWSHDPILSVGESFTTVLHCESSSWLFALIEQLGSAGITVEEVWPLPTWLQALPDEWSETGASTVLAIAGNRACAYHHPATGARQVITWPPNQPTTPDLWLANLLDRDPAEPVLVVTDEAVPRATWSPDPMRPGLRHLTLTEALSHSATIPSRHSARLLPAEPAVTASRVVLAASLALLIAAGGMVGPWMLAHVNARHAVLVQTTRERALSADVAHLRANAAEIAALREEVAGHTAPFAGALLRRLAATVPPEVTLATLRADTGSFAAQGFVAPQASRSVLDRWQQALAPGGERPQVQIESLPKSDGAFRLHGQGKT
jgi:hypothetical protein